MNIILVSGLSGSGKSITLHLLEDVGYYCIDNLPVALIAQVTQHVSNNYSNIAIGIDSRSLPANSDELYQSLQEYKNKYSHCQIIYLDSSEDVLIKRFSETRRKHPLSNINIPLQEAIKLEKRLISSIANLADLRIDTTQHSLQQLRNTIYSRVTAKQSSTSILIQSFGFKHGVPLDSDLVFDVRMLPNPYWYPELRHHTGLESVIAKFLDSKEQTKSIYNDLKNFLTTWMPKYEDNNRSYLTVSIGCTGGQHRSVYIAQKIYEYFTASKKNLQIRHRELS